MSTARSATSGSNSRGAVDAEIPGSPDAQPSSASRSERSRLKSDAEDFFGPKRIEPKLLVDQLDMSEVSAVIMGSILNDNMKDITRLSSAITNDY